MSDANKAIEVLRRMAARDADAAGRAKTPLAAQMKRANANALTDAAELLCALQARNAALVEALRVADVEIMENVRAFEGVASDIRAAIEAARGE